jgi:hormone-sensitive lipase
MNPRATIAEALSRIDQILKAISTTKFNIVPVDLPQLNLTLVKIKAKLESLLPERILESINPVSTSHYMVALLKYLHILSQESSVWKGNLKENQEEDLIIILSKLQTLSDFLEIAPYVPLDDLFSLNPDSDTWVELNKAIEYFGREKVTQVRRSYFKFMTRVASSQAFVSKAFEEEEGIKRKLMLGIGSMYYTIYKKKALRKTQILYAKPRLDVAIHVWNLLETKMVRKLMNLVIKSIKFNKVIHVPRITSHVLQDYCLLNIDPVYTLLPLEDSVMVRLLNTQPLFGFTKKPLELHKKVIIHIHGGGFMSMSSASHQAYTRIWSTEVGVPVISIDYRLAPQHPYPAALDDVWQVWNWLVNQGEAQLGIKLSQYVIVGDSAGGNLALALTYKILKNNFEPPTGLLLAYPALNLDQNNFSPSLMFALEDLLVPHTFLKLCLESYMQSNEDPKQPTISPLYIEEEILRSFPKVRTMVGGDDPLHDDCFRFTNRLIKSGVDAKLAVFSGACHGSLNFCVKGGVKESMEVVNKGTIWIKEILDIK